VLALEAVAAMEVVEAVAAKEVVEAVAAMETVGCRQTSIDMSRCACRAYYHWYAPAPTPPQ
jgi:site-specific recombinase XerC